MRSGPRDFCESKIQPLFRRREGRGDRQTQHAKARRADRDEQRRNRITSERQIGKTLLDQVRAGQRVSHSHSIIMADVI